MKISELFGRGRPVFSFEFFPPKTDEAASSMLATVKDLADVLSPDFVSVTYGAGGSTRGRTVELVSRMQSELGLTTMAHLTCVGHTRDELGTILDRLASRGIKNVLALRGDAPGGKFEPTPGGFAHASDLAAFLRERYRFCVGGACYPEKHPESPDGDEDLRWTAHKVAAGTEFLITQLFFDADDYDAFVARARAAGITVPIVPGIMPVVSAANARRMAQLCGSRIPDELEARLVHAGDDEDATLEVGIAWAAAQCRTLLERGAPGLHFYTLNRSPAARRVHEIVFA